MMRLHLGRPWEAHRGSCGQFGALSAAIPGSSLLARRKTKIGHYCASLIKRHPSRPGDTVASDSTCTDVDEERNVWRLWNICVTVARHNDRTDWQVP